MQPHKLAVGGRQLQARKRDKIRKVTFQSDNQSSFNLNVVRDF
jgi:hypothetical protein